MSRRPMLLSLLAVAVVILSSLTMRAAELHVPEGFTPLFNGENLTGWHGWAIHEKDSGPYDEISDEKRAAWDADARKHWSVVDGELINDGQGAYLATDKEFGDMELLIEYRTVPKADSGIYLRATPQVQIWDYTDEGKFSIGGDKGSGGLWNNSPGAPGKDPLVKADKPLGEWNQFRIIQVGQRTTIYLNDQLIVDHALMENFWNRELPLLAKGSILLQTHGGEIRWRNIFVREIGTEEANQILAKKAGEGFQPLFNGENLEGWTGAVDDYEVTDGAIVCKPNKGGNLYTKDTFADFSVFVEYKLPPGGNNGLSIRYPGTGTSSETGMCEVQILDDTAEKYAMLDPRQYNGSVYGMIPAVRGYLRPVGEWNFMQVTVRGPKIQVELNGTKIVDGDVSKVTEFMGDSKHVGKDRTEGHFGLAGHSDPVQFRNIQLKRFE